MGGRTSGGGGAESTSAVGKGACVGEGVGCGDGDGDHVGYQVRDEGGGAIRYLASLS